MFEDRSYLPPMQGFGVSEPPQADSVVDDTLIDPECEDDGETSHAEQFTTRGRPVKKPARVWNQSCEDYTIVASSKQRGGTTEPHTDEINPYCTTGEKGPEVRD
ncbi:unnamed protein product [Clavelina lepadiformis]|uniref:Uncharacterized protein n=1 Tax=Clavelina lepadiformis TaxID=159417 RepID=A0ABP0G8S2_CLALP